MKVKFDTPKNQIEPKEESQNPQLVQTSAVEEGLKLLRMGSKIQEVLLCGEDHIRIDRCPSTPHNYLKRKWCCRCFVKALMMVENGIKVQESKQKEKITMKIGPSKKVSTKEAPVKKEKSGKKEKVERTPRLVGKRLKLGINQTWIHLFQENERLAKSDKAKTDAEITEFMYSEFPGRKSKVFAQVATCRSRYNRGVITGGEPPKIQSNPYNKEEKKEKTSKKK